jgi:hypothetical protein
MPPRRLDSHLTLAENEYDFREVCKGLGVNNETALELAHDTIENIIAAMQKQSYEGTLAQYYNTYRMAMDKSLNAFLTHTKLEPIAHLFRLKSDIKISEGWKRLPHEYVTFTMLKKHYEYYRTHGVAPKVQNNGSIAKNGNAKRTLIKFDGGGTVKCPQNASFEQFKNGINAYNQQNGTKHTIPQMLMTIIDEYMKERPEIFGVKKAVIDESKLVQNESGNFHWSTTPEQLSKLKLFVQRYNACNNPPVTMNEIVTRSVKRFLGAMPLIYTDPKAYAEQVTLQAQVNKTK